MSICIFYAVRRDINWYNHINNQFGIIFVELKACGILPPVTALLIIGLQEALSHVPQEKQINENVYNGIINSKNNRKQPNFPLAKE